MATTTAKKKASTTKKPATKKPVTKKAPAKKPAPKKAAAATKKTTTKVVSAAPKTTVQKTNSRSTARPVLTPMQRLRSFHFGNVFIYLAFAIGAFFLMGNTAKEVLLNYQAKNDFISGDAIALTPANEVMFSLEYRYILMAVLILGAIGSLLVATRLWKRYEGTLKGNVSGMRWLVTGISTAVLVELASFAAGVQDIATIKLVAGAVLLASLLGWLAERENAGSATPKRLAFYGSIFAYILALLPLASSLMGTVIYSTERFSWFVYALAGVVTVGIIANLLVQRRSIIHKARFEYLVFERFYWFIDRFVKAAAVLILLLAIK